MSQHDYDLTNQSGAAFRSDLNNALAAILSVNSGASAPSTTAPYQLWADTTNGLVKQRNAADSAWLVRWSLSETFALSRSSNTILGVADYRRTIIATAAFTQTLTAAATLGDGWEVNIRNASTGKLVIDPNSSETIDGATTITLDPGQSCRIVCNGTAFFTIGLQARNIVKYKASDESVSSSTTMQDDDDLLLTLGVNEVWVGRINLNIAHSSSGAGGFKAQFTRPSGATDWVSQQTIHASGAGTSMANAQDGAEFTNFVTSVNNSVLQGFFYIANGATPGTYQMQWAQSSSSASATVLRAGSSMMAWKVG